MCQQQFSLLIMKTPMTFLLSHHFYSKVVKLSNTIAFLIYNLYFWILLCKLKTLIFVLHIKISRSHPMLFVLFQISECKKARALQTDLERMTNY
ncbi:hypothetical protein MtrunA17_Chr6g0457881 [Medicago truncatula]|uniref:Transmembrane protein n=1 Tax=Medicago truncatula TaxID=3880 RepID=A0A396HB80_MEDTR|nr:hypothetical protein MtrunA17_Chr6g0457881 [Medicago truncatula]